MSGDPTAFQKNGARKSGNEFMNNGARKSGNEQNNRARKSENEFSATEPGGQRMNSQQQSQEVRRMSKTMEPGSQENAGRGPKCFYNPGHVYIISK